VSLVPKAVILRTATLLADMPEGGVIESHDQPAGHVKVRFDPSQTIRTVTV
jgi:hypothetical protein